MPGSLNSLGNTIQPAQVSLFAELKEVRGQLQGVPSTSKHLQLRDMSTVSIFSILSIL